VTAAHNDESTSIVGRHSVFGRILVGVDGSPESSEAARQAALLAEGSLTLLGVYDITPRIVGGTGVSVPAQYDEEYQRELAEKAVEHARDQIANSVSPSGEIVRGRSWQAVINEIERKQSTLVAIGSHGVGRARGVLVGSTATELVHKSPCSVLVAREASDSFPERITVGVDGSPESAAAYAAARHVAQRFDAEVSSVVAHGGKGVDERLVGMIVGEGREDSAGQPVAALVAAGEASDLVVVGSRGLHGLKSIGSVSERVAHQARCSVLVVREPPWQRVAEALGGEPSS
jgi:nucleotide-binding universal stress UspA family protein